jgi:hypothetical protein
LVDKRTVSTLEAVANLTARTYFYNRVEMGEARILGETPADDSADLYALWAIYWNPDVIVFGPNDL